MKGFKLKLKFNFFETLKRPVVTIVEGAVATVVELDDGDDDYEEVDADDDEELVVGICQKAMMMMMIKMMMMMTTWPTVWGNIGCSTYSRRPV